MRKASSWKCQIQCLAIQLHFRCLVVSTFVMYSLIQTFCVLIGTLSSLTACDFPVFILWFGWYGFIVGSAITIIGPNQDKIISTSAVNTTLSAASSCFSALLVNYVIVERQSGEGEFSLLAAMNGCLSGLVAITGGCAGKIDEYSNRHCIHHF